MFGLGSDSIFRKKKKHHQIRLFRVSLLARIRGFIACRARRAARSPHDRGEKSAVAHNDGVLARAVFFHRLGEIRDRTFENQRYRDSGLNLAVAAIILWNTVYLSRAVTQLRSQGEIVSDDLLAHVPPLGWEHITFNGDYVWPT
jgi:hypothetical protein